MMELALALAVGFAPGYGEREWVSRQRRRAFGRQRRSLERPSQFAPIARLGSSQRGVASHACRRDIVATLLAACSGSSRVEHVVPAWANTPTRPAPQFEAGKGRADERGKRDAEPQPAKPSPAQGHSEE